MAGSSDLGTEASVWEELPTKTLVNVEVSFHILDICAISSYLLC